MSNENEGGLFSCPVMCWIIGALLAVATYLILSGRFEVGTVLALILALGVLIVSGALLGRLFCRDVAASQTIASSAPSTVSKSASAGVAAAAVAGAATAASASKAKSAVAGAKPAAKPKAKAAAKPKAKSASAASTGAKKAAAKPAAKPKAKAAAKPKAKAAAKKPAAKTASKPARKAVTKDGKPEMLKKARAGGADDLKQIKGVGPKMETMLNKMGVYHFDQVSGWRAQEVKWADENLEGFKGRVSRDEWVKQAKILAKGGKTEFSKKVAKGGVYAKNKK